MLCKYPTVFPNTKGVPVKCGRCTHCRIADRRIWTHRIVLESMHHPSNVFLTLTYNNDHLPTEFVHPETGQVYAPNSVNPLHHELFLKSLRERYFREYGKTLRMFGVGEYGEKTQRPHYHYALFNFPRCTGIRTRGIYRQCQCPSCLLVTRSWDYGHTFTGELTLESSQYIAGYVTKKLTNDHSEWNQKILAGRHPEFSRQSRRPGLAAWAADGIADKLEYYNQFGSIDIPKTLIHAGKHLPLGRYLSDRLHEKMGIKIEEGERLKNYERSLFGLFLDPKIPPKIAKICLTSPASALTAINAAYTHDLETKTRLFTKEKLI